MVVLRHLKANRRASRAVTLVLISGGSLLFVPFAAQAQNNQTITSPQLTAQAMDMSESCFAQIQALMAEKRQRTPAQRKVDSQLLYAAKMVNGQEIVPGLNHLEVAIETDMLGRALVNLDAKVTPQLLEAIRTSGGEVVTTVPNYNTIQAWVNLKAVEWLASSKDVKAIQIASKPVNDTGSVTGQGAVAHGTEGNSGVRAIYGTDGSGVLVGTLSDSDTRQAASIASGDLPHASGAEPTVQDLPGQTGTATNAEGTAMMEIIHDIAPGAGLRFATAHSTQATFAQNIVALKNAGCSVIVDDVRYLDEPPFMDGTVAQAVDTVTAGGVLYFASSGNQGNSNYYNTSGGPINLSSVWEGDFSNGGPINTGPLAGITAVHKYPNGALYNSTKGAANVYLYWSDPQGGSANDYDLYATSADGNTLTSASENEQSGTQNPLEVISPGGVRRVYITKFNGADRMLHLNGFTANYAGGYFTYTTDGQTHAHSQARNAFGVAASPAQSPAESNGFAGPYPNDFTILYNSTPGNVGYEYFSSDGPRRVFYLNNGAEITPGNYLSSGGELRKKPDLTAADGVTMSAAFNGTALQPFYGTSAAAPHAAAIAALVRSYKSVNATAAANVPAGVTIDGSKFTRDEMRTILINGCLDLKNNGATAGWDKVTGYGILQPGKALAFVTAFANPNLISVVPATNSATVSWTTALSADSVVEYGTTSGVYPNSATGASGTNHTVTLSGLSQGTLYYYRVKSKTGSAVGLSGAVFVSPGNSFVTSGTITSNASIVGTGASSTSANNPVVTVTIKNAGTGAATNLKITSVVLGSKATTTALPTAAFNLASGATTTRAFSFTGVPQGTYVMIVKGTYNGASFNFSLRVTVPGIPS